MVVVVVQLPSCIQLFETPWTVTCQDSLFFIISQSLSKSMSIESVMPSNHLILCRPLLLFSVFPSIRVFCLYQFVSVGQSIGASASTLVLPVTIQGWSPLGLTGLISLLPKGLSKVFSSTTVKKHQFFGTLLSLWSNSNIHTWLLERPLSWLYRPLLAKWYQSNHFLISWLQSPSAVTLEPKKRKSHCIHIFPFLFAMKWWDWMTLS